MDMTGHKCGRLTVVARAANNKAGRAMWHCRCECGVTVVVWGAALRNGTTRSCGCLNREATAKATTTHGGARLSGHEPLYRVWRSMKRCCRAPVGTDDWRRYAGRGIHVCDRWADYANFRDDMLPTWRRGLTIDRIDNDGNYEPSNCRWATKKVQARNRRTNFYISYNGETKTVAQWAEDTGIPVSRIYQRIVKLGWPPEKALSPRTFEHNHQPAKGRTNTRLLTYSGETLPMHVWAKRHNMSSGLLHARLTKLGWPVDRAISEPVRHLKALSQPCSTKT